MIERQRVAEFADPEDAKIDGRTSCIKILGCHRTGPKLFFSEVFASVAYHLE